MITYEQLPRYAKRVFLDISLRVLSNFYNTYGGNHKLGLEEFAKYLREKRMELDK